MTRVEMLNKGSQMLTSAQVPDARQDAWLLLEDTLNVTRAEYLLYPDINVGDELSALYEQRIRERMTRRPLQYILGCQEFMGLQFQVNESVLIPRQDTEILVEKVLPFVKDKRVLDMCTGSGCIAISLMKLGNASSVLATDLSLDALQVARDNALRNDCSVQFRKSNLWDDITEHVDVIVSNPPYIETEVVKGLMPEVRDYEPMMALDGSTDGCYYYEKIIENAKEHLYQGGHIFFEIGYNQADRVSELLHLAGFESIEVWKDYAGLDRVVHARHGDEK